MGDLTILAATPDAALLDLPWQLPLADWQAEHIALLPKGISRHLVRFANLSGSVVAIKETGIESAEREYELLRSLRRLDIPCVEPVAVVTGRVHPDGRELSPALVTRHLKFSLPYRALFSQQLREDTATRLIDALAVLLVRLHIAGFYWGDVSLSNTLFRRDAGAFAAYLVDAETGELHEAGLTDGQREHDLEIAGVNIIGELFDLEAGGRLDEGVDPVAVGHLIEASYRNLWSELTGAQSFSSAERWRIAERVARLNGLGFDIDELEMASGDAGTTFRIRPKVVDAGHHQRRLLRLTGLDTQENQARRLLNDLDSYAATLGGGGRDEEVVAHEWLVRVFEPVVRAIPTELRGKLEPAEVFHELLEHRWFLSQRQGADVPLAVALSSYIDEVLRHRRDEATLLAPPTETLSLPVVETGSIAAVGQAEGDERDWRRRV